MKTKNTEIYENFKTSYVRKQLIYKSDRKKILAKIEQREKQIERLQKKKDRLHYPHWTEELLRPIINEVARLTPDLHWDFIEGSQDLNPMGMCARVSVFAYTQKYCQFRTQQCAAYLAFTPTDLDNGRLSYDTGEETGRFKQGTMGYDNGMNAIAEPVESIEQLVKFVRKQVSEFKTKNAA